MQEPARRFAIAALAATLGACTRDAPTSALPACNLGPEDDGTAIPACLVAQGIVDQANYALDLPVLTRAVVVRDSLRYIGDNFTFSRSQDLSRALQKLTNYYVRGILDSVRFNRVVDYIAATVEKSTGVLRTANNLYWPRRNPNTVWTLEPVPGSGVFYQPVTTVNSTGLYDALARVSTDSLAKVGESLWSYATWVTLQDGRRFPLWLYDFDWSSGLTLQGPWRSGLAEGLAIQGFVNLYARAQDPKWIDRARQVTLALTVPWDSGGVMVSDQDGAWFEEFHPTVRIWNGHVWTLLALGAYLKVAPDSMLQELYTSGVRAAHIYAQRYDTGSWLMYSRAGYVDQNYRTMEVSLAQQLTAQSGDAYFASAAATWAGYAVPAGIPLSVENDLPSDLSAMVLRFAR